MNRVGGTQLLDFEGELHQLLVICIIFFSRLPTSKVEKLCDPARYSVIIHSQAGSMMPNVLRRTATARTTVIRHPAHGKAASDADHSHINSRSASMAIKASEHIWYNGNLIPWDDAKLHVMAHVVNYGSSVFEGIRCYHTEKGPAIFRLRDHMQRCSTPPRFTAWTSTTPSTN